MPRLDFANVVLVYGPLLLLGLAAGAIHGYCRRPDLPRRRRRALQATWVLLLLAGVPLWLVLAAVLRIW